jgi:PKHD-type hydroxylase
MPDSFLHIPGLLKPDELEQIDEICKTARFIDGRATAGMAAKEVKNNLQMDVLDKEHIELTHEIIGKAIMSSPLFQAAVMPRYIYPFIISRYGPGMYYGWHVDSPVMGAPPLRTDVAMTIFLSDPAEYTGGELVMQAGGQIVSFKPAKGDAVAYPCQFLHCVNEVTAGERKAAVTWIQCGVREPGKRKILFDLNQTHQLLLKKDMHAPENNMLLQCYSNLMRMWADG